MVLTGPIGEIFLADFLLKCRIRVTSQLGIYSELLFAVYVIWKIQKYISSNCWRCNCPVMKPTLWFTTPSLMEMGMARNLN
jgi:hypothetical protein